MSCSVTKKVATTDVASLHLFNTAACKAYKEITWSLDLAWLSAIRLALAVCVAFFASAKAACKTTKRVQSLCVNAMSKSRGLCML